MTAAVEMTLFGEVVLRRRLLRTHSRLTDASSAFHAVIPIVEEGIRQEFATQGAAGGTPWEDLAPSTVAYKARHNLRPEVMRATDRLYASLFGGSDHIEEVGPTELRIGSRVPYGKYHQSTAPRSRLPWRPIKLPPASRRSAVRALQGALLA